MNSGEVDGARGYHRDMMQAAVASAERPLRVGVVGVGVMGSNHARVFAGLPGVELIGVADPDRKQAEFVARTLSCSAVSDVSELLERDIDAITIAAPTHLHREIALACIARGIHVMLALAFASVFPDAGHAAAWGVLVAGVLEFLLLAGAAGRAGVLTKLRRPTFDADVRRFFRALGPATVGSMGVQLALFADTIIASFLPSGALSALYYADRLNQLPIGVIGIAAGTVILPEMARRIAGGDHQGAGQAQSRAIEFTLLLAIPWLLQDIQSLFRRPDPRLWPVHRKSGAYLGAHAGDAAAHLAGHRKRPKSSRFLRTALFTIS